MISEYISPRMFEANVRLGGAIPADSVILAVVVQVYNDKSGTVTLQTEQVDSTLPSRIFYIDYITARGKYTGNSSKEYFVSKQNLMVESTGSINFNIKILFWEVGK